MMTSEMTQRSNSFEDHENGNKRAEAQSSVDCVDGNGGGASNMPKDGDGRCVESAQDSQQKRNLNTTEGNQKVTPKNTQSTTVPSPRPGSPMPPQDAREDIPQMEVDTASLLMPSAERSRTGASDQDITAAAVGDAASGLNCAQRIWNCLRKKLCLLCLAIVVIILIVIDIVIFKVILPDLQTKLHHSLVLRKETSDAWVHPKVPTYLSLYMFDIGFNDDDGMYVTEQGPYVYRVKVERVNVTWNKNHTVSYQEMHTFHFDQSRSNGSESDLVTTVNIPLLTLDKRAGKARTLIRSLLSEKAKEMFQQHTVAELLWGYDNNLLQDIDTLQRLDFLHIFHKTEEKRSPHIGFFDKINGTIGSIFNVYTGESDISLLTQIHSWNYTTKFPYWKTEEANEMRGTDGGMFGPFVSEKSHLTLFYPQLFRTFDLQFSKETSYKGLDTLRFIIPDADFSNGTEELVAAGDDEERPCQWNSKDDEGNGYCNPKCVPSGIYSISVQSQGIDMYVSLPHFLGADPYYRRQVDDGLKPDEAKHRPFFDVDKSSGITVSSRRRHQLNMHVKTEHLHEAYLPLFWIELSADLEDADVALLKVFNCAQTIVFAVGIFIAAVATLLSFLVIFFSVYHLLRGCEDDDDGQYRPLSLQPDHPTQRGLCGCCTTV